MNLVDEEKNGPEEAGLVLESTSFLRIHWYYRKLHNPHGIQPHDKSLSSKPHAWRVQPPLVLNNSNTIIYKLNLEHTNTRGYSYDIHN